MARQTAYQRVYQALKAAIFDGGYAEGALLPPENSLCAQYQVSRTTVRKAMEMLAQEGFIAIRQGVGTRVLARKPSQSLNLLTSFSHSLEKQGHTIGLKHFYIEKTGADERLSELLQLPLQTPLFSVCRIKLSDGKPICITKNYLPVSLAPELDQDGEILRLYRHLSDRYGVRYSGARDLIGACSASFEEALLLETEPRAALITVQRLCYRNGKPAEADFLKIIADRYEFEVRIHGSESGGEW